MGPYQGIIFGAIHSLDPHLFFLMGIEQLLATYTKDTETSSLNAHNLRDILDYLSRLSITGIMLVGTAGMAGLFTGQSIGISTPVRCHG